MEITSTSSALIPRPPSQGERDELRAYCQELCACPELADDAYVAVFDDYVTDCPGYAGKVLVVIWTGMPSQIDSFTWRDGKMTHCERE